MDEEGEENKEPNLCKLSSDLVTYCGNDTTSCFYLTTKCNGVSDCPNGYDESVEMCGECADGHGQNDALVSFLIIEYSSEWSGRGPHS